MILFTFLSFQGFLWAFALKGTWLILLAPAVVCGYKGWELYRELRRTGRRTDLS